MEEMPKTFYIQEAGDPTTPYWMSSNLGEGVSYIKKSIADELCAALEEAFKEGFYETSTENYDLVPKAFSDKARAAIKSYREGV